MSADMPAGETHQQTIKDEPTPVLGSIPPRMSDGRFMAHRDAPWVNLPSEQSLSPPSTASAVQYDLSALREQVRQRSRPVSRAASVASARSQRSIPEDQEVQHELSPAAPLMNDDALQYNIASSDEPQLTPVGNVDDDLIDSMFADQMLSLSLIHI